MGFIRFLIAQFNAKAILEQIARDGLPETKQWLVDQCGGHWGGWKPEI